MISCTKSSNIVRKNNVGKILSLQDNNTTEKKIENILYPLRINDNYGFINQSGQLVLSPDFREAKKTSNGFAVAKKDDITYYLNTDGSILFSISNQSQFLREFSEGLLAKKNIDAKWGFVDISGNWIIQPVYASVSDFSEGLANVSYGDADKSFFIDKNNRPVFGTQKYLSEGFKNGYAYVRKRLIQDFYVARVDGDSKYQELINGSFGGIIDKQGNLIIPFILGTNTEYSEGLFATTYRNIENEKNDIQTLMGYINIKNKIVIEPKYSLAYKFTDGVAVVSFDGKKYGLINKAGDFVLEPKYAKLSTMSSGLILFSLTGEKYGFIDKYGEVKIPPLYDFANSFNEDLAFIIKDNIPGYITKDNICFLATDYNNVLPSPVRSR